MNHKMKYDLDWKRANEILGKLDVDDAEFFRRFISLDSLTGLLNGPAFHDVLNKEVHRVQDDHSKLCVAILDIDGFKEYQDSNGGHTIGDNLIVQIGNIINKGFHDYDLTSRLHGDEFAVGLININCANALKATNRVRETIAQQTPVTVSIGVAEYTLGMHASELIQRADDAHYDAKRKGKNLSVPYRE